MNQQIATKDPRQCRDDPIVCLVGFHPQIRLNDTRLETAGIGGPRCGSVKTLMHRSRMGGKPQPWLFRTSFLAVATKRVAVLAAIASASAACTDAGGLSIRLSLPAAEELSPAAEVPIANVTLVVRDSIGEVERRTRTMSEAGSGLDLGSLSPNEALNVAVELRSVGGQLLGYGRSPAPIEVRAGKNTVIELNVRRPLAYLPNQTGMLVAVDASRDLASAITPGIDVSGTPTATALSGDGGDLYVALASGGTSTLALVSTSTHLPSREIASGLRPAPTDLVLSDDGVYAALGHRSLAGGAPGGVTVIEVPTGTATFVELGSVSRLTIDTRGELFALADRSTSCLEPPRVATLYRLSLGDVESRAQLAYAGSASDIATNPATGGLLVADPCSGEVTELSVDESSATRFFALVGASALAASEDQILIAGIDATGLTAVTVSPSGELINTVALPAPTESMISEDLGGEGQSVSIEVEADEAAVLDLAAVPGSESFVVITRTLYDVVGAGNIPSMSSNVWEYQLIDASSETAVHRIRTACELDVRPDFDDLPNWRCGRDSDQLALEPQFKLETISVLYGAR